jgi:hypothetical protein
MPKTTEEASTMLTRLLEQKERHKITAAQSGYSAQLYEVGRKAGHPDLTGVSVSNSPIALNEFRADFALLFIGPET